MLLFPLISFIAAILFFVFGLLIYLGKTGFINRTGQDMADKAAYGRDFGRVYLITAALFALSGLVSLWGTAAGLLLSALLELAAFVLLPVLLIRVQRKYSGRS